MIHHFPFLLVFLLMLSSCSPCRDYQVTGCPIFPIPSPYTV